MKTVLSESKFSSSGDLAIQDLPESMQIAINAIETDEVQQIIKTLSEYNLGVTMPHMHRVEGEFSELPVGVIALERQSDFVNESEIDCENTLPVTWRWKNGKVVVAGSCHILRKRCGR
jgi:hypothetical protein